MSNKDISSDDEPQQNDASHRLDSLARRSVLSDQRLILLVYCVAALVVTIQRGVFGFPNDFAIFRASFWNLLASRDLYILRLDQARDYFKYSPSFALLFAPFAILPFVAGLFTWNVVNALALFFALRLLLPQRQWALAQALAFLPMLRSMQSAQSNGLVAALIIVAFVSFERGWLRRGAVSVALGTATKLFPVVAIVFALPRRERIRAVLMTILATAIVIALPLLIVAPRTLIAEYHSWAVLERSEGALVGSSAMSLLRDAGINWPAWPVQIAAGIILLEVLILRARDWGDSEFRLRFLAFVLVFCVVFNHRAERQSAVIAMCGAIIWYLTAPRTASRTALFASIYFLVVLTGSDIVPNAIKALLVPAVRFPIPLTVLWLVMLGELAIGRRDRSAFPEAR